MLARDALHALVLVGLAILCVIAQLVVTATMSGWFLIALFFLGMAFSKLVTIHNRITVLRSYRDTTDDTSRP